MSYVLNFDGFVKQLNESLSSDHDEYSGQHSAPQKQDNAPMHDLTGIYPEDIYSIDAVRMYGYNENPSVDNESLSIIKSCKGRPNKQVKIYRAVPDFNYDLTKKITELSDIISYYSKYNFYPTKNTIVHNLEAKYEDDFDKGILTYNQVQQNVYNDITTEITDLSSKKVGLAKINKGDWITISKTYAIQHGRDNLKNRYKIISKTVPAKYLFTDGNNINEWGYDPV